MHPIRAIARAQDALHEFQSLHALVFLCASHGVASCAGCGLSVPGPKPMLVTQLFFGRSVPHRGPVTAGEWSRFLREHVTTLFPDGFTVYDGYGQWLNPKTQAISRDPTKVVVIATADTRKCAPRSLSCRRPTERLFHQESVGVLSATECGAF